MKIIILFPLYSLIVFLSQYFFALASLDSLKSNGCPGLESHLANAGVTVHSLLSQWISADNHDLSDCGHKIFQDYSKEIEMSVLDIYKMALQKDLKTSALTILLKKFYLMFLMDIEEEEAFSHILRLIGKQLDQRMRDVMDRLVRATKSKEFGLLAEFLSALYVELKDNRILHVLKINRHIGVFAQNIFTTFDILSSYQYRDVFHTNLNILESDLDIKKDPKMEYRVIANILGDGFIMDSELEGAFPGYVAIYIQNVLHSLKNKRSDQKINDKITELIGHLGHASLFHKIFRNRPVLFSFFFNRMIQMPDFKSTLLIGGYHSVKKSVVGGHFIAYIVEKLSINDDSGNEKTIIRVSAANAGHGISQYHAMKFKKDKMFTNPIVSFDIPIEKFLNSNFAWKVKILMHYIHIGNNQIGIRDVYENLFSAFYDTQYFPIFSDLSLLQTVQRSGTCSASSYFAAFLFIIGTVHHYKIIKDDIANEITLNLISLSKKLHQLDYLQSDFIYFLRRVSERRLMKLITHENDQNAFLKMIFKGDSFKNLLVDGYSTAELIHKLPLRIASASFAPAINSYSIPDLSKGTELASSEIINLKAIHEANQLLKNAQSPLKSTAFVIPDLLFDPNSAVSVCKVIIDSDDLANQPVHIGSDRWVDWFDPCEAREFFVTNIILNYWKISDTFHDLCLIDEFWITKNDTIDDLKSKQKMILQVFKIFTRLFEKHFTDKKFDILAAFTLLIVYHKLSMHADGSICSPNSKHPKEKYHLIGLSEFERHFSLKILPLPYQKNYWNIKRYLEWQSQQNIAPICRLDTQIWEHVQQYTQLSENSWRKWMGRFVMTDFADAVDFKWTDDIPEAYIADMTFFAILDIITVDLISIDMPGSKRTKFEYESSLGSFSEDFEYWKLGYFAGNIGSKLTHGFHEPDRRGIHTAFKNTEYGRSQYFAASIGAHRCIAIDTVLSAINLNISYVDFYGVIILILQVLRFPEFEGLTALEKAPETMSSFLKSVQEKLIQHWKDELEGKRDFSSLDLEEAKHQKFDVHRNYGHYYEGIIYKAAEVYKYLIEVAHVRSNIISETELERFGNELSRLFNRRTFSNNISESSYMAGVMKYMHHMYKERVEPDLVAEMMLILHSDSEMSFHSNCVPLGFYKFAREFARHVNRLFFILSMEEKKYALKKYFLNLRLPKKILSGHKTASLMFLSASYVVLRTDVCVYCMALNRNPALMSHSEEDLKKYKYRDISKETFDPFSIRQCLLLGNPIDKLTDESISEYHNGQRLPHWNGNISLPLKETAYQISPRYIIAFKKEKPFLSFASCKEMLNFEFPLRTQSTCWTDGINTVKILRDDFDKEMLFNASAYFTINISNASVHFPDCEQIAWKIKNPGSSITSPKIASILDMPYLIVASGSDQVRIITSFLVDDNQLLILCSDDNHKTFYTLHDRNLFLDSTSVGDLGHSAVIFSSITSAEKRHFLLAYSKDRSISWRCFFIPFKIMSSDLINFKPRDANEIIILIDTLNSIWRYLDIIRVIRDNFAAILAIDSYLLERLKTVHQQLRMTAKIPEALHAICFLGYTIYRISDQLKLRMSHALLDDIGEDLYSYYSIYHNVSTKYWLHWDPNIFYRESFLTKYEEIRFLSSFTSGSNIAIYNRIGNILFDKNLSLEKKLVTEETKTKPKPDDKWYIRPSGYDIPLQKDKLQYTLSNWRPLRGNSTNNMWPSRNLLYIAIEKPEPYFKQFQRILDSLKTDPGYSHWYVLLNTVISGKLAKFHDYFLYSTAEHKDVVEEFIKQMKKISASETKSHVVVYRNITVPFVLSFSIDLFTELSQPSDVFDLRLHGECLDTIDHMKTIILDLLATTENNNQLASTFKLLLGDFSRPFPYIISLFARRNMEWIKLSYPLISENVIDKVIGKMGLYIKCRNDQLHEKLNTERAYPIEKYPILAVLESAEDFAIRPLQFYFIDNCQIHKSFVFQMMMGAGKSSVIGPVLQYLFSDGYHLVISVPPTSLFPQNSIEFASRSIRNLRQEGTVIEIGRNENYIEPQFLNDLLQTFYKSIKHQNYLIMSPESLKGLLNQWVELVEMENIDESSFSLLKNVMNLIKDRGVGIFDELDLTYWPFISLNYPTNSTIKLNHISLRMIRDIVQHLVIKHADLIGIYKNSQFSLIDEDIEKLKQISRNFIVEQAVHGDWKGWIGSEISGLGPHELERDILEFIDGKQKKYAPWISFLLLFGGKNNKAPAEFEHIAGRLALLRLFVNEYLSICLKGSVGVHYGFSNSPLEYLFIRPFDAAQSPDNHSYFNDPWQIYIRTQFATALVGFTQSYYGHVSKFCEFLQQRVDLELRFGNTDTLNMLRRNAEIPMLSEKNIAANTELIEKINNSSAFIPAQASSFDERASLMNLYMDFYEQQFKTKLFHFEQRTAHSINVYPMLKRFYGYSATITNIHVLPPSFVRSGDFELNEHILMNIENHVRTHCRKIVPVLAPDQKPSELFQHSDFSTDSDNEYPILAFMDVGAYCQQIPNSLVAESILELAKTTKDSVIDTVFYFHNEEKVLYSLSYKSNMALNSRKVPTEKREILEMYDMTKVVIYFDQLHCTGIDLPLALKIRFIVSVKADNNWSQVSQAILRARNVLDSPITQKLMLFTDSFSENLILDRCKKPQFRKWVQLNRSKVLPEEYFAAPISTDLLVDVLKYNLHCKEFAEIKRTAELALPDVLRSYIMEKMLKQETRAVCQQYLKEFRGIFITEMDWIPTKLIEKVLRESDDEVTPLQRTFDELHQMIEKSSILLPADQNGLKNLLQQEFDYYTNLLTKYMIDDTIDLPFALSVKNDRVIEIATAAQVKEEEQAEHKKIGQETKISISLEKEVNVEQERKRINALQEKKITVEETWPVINEPKLILSEALTSGGFEKMIDSTANAKFPFTFAKVYNELEDIYHRRYVYFSKDSLGYKEYMARQFGELFNPSYTYGFGFKQFRERFAKWVETKTGENPKRRFHEETIMDEFYAEVRDKIKLSNLEEKGQEISSKYEHVTLKPNLNRLGTLCTLNTILSKDKEFKIAKFIFSEDLIGTLNYFSPFDQKIPYTLETHYRLPYQVLFYASPRMSKMILLTVSEADEFKKIIPKWKWETDVYLSLERIDDYLIVSTSSEEARAKYQSIRDELFVQASVYVGNYKILCSYKYMKLFKKWIEQKNLMNARHRSAIFHVLERQLLKGHIDGYIHSPIFSLKKKTAVDTFWQDLFANRKIFTEAERNLLAQLHSDGSKLILTENYDLGPTAAVLNIIGCANRDVEGILAKADETIQIISDFLLEQEVIVSEANLVLERLEKLMKQTSVIPATIDKALSLSPLKRKKLTEKIEAKASDITYYTYQALRCLLEFKYPPINAQCAGIQPSERNRSFVVEIENSSKWIKSNESSTNSGQLKKMKKFISAVSKKRYASKTDCYTDLGDSMLVLLKDSAE